MVSIPDCRFANDLSIAFFGISLKLLSKFIIEQFLRNHQTTNWIEWSLHSVIHIEKRSWIEFFTWGVLGESWGIPCIVQYDETGTKTCEQTTIYGASKCLFDYSGVTRPNRGALRVTASKNFGRLNHSNIFAPLKTKI